MQQAMTLYQQQQQLPSGGHVLHPPHTIVAPTASGQNPTSMLGATRSKHWTGNMTRTIAHYQRMEQIGEGAYGQVYKARCVDSGRLVALKKLIIQHGGYNGMPPSVIREIKILQRLRHPRLVEMIEVVSSKGVEHLDEHDDHRGDQKKKELSQDNSSKSESRIIDAREGYKGNLFLVLEYVSHDLMALLDVRYQFSEQQVKCIFKQLLEALEYMHDQKYVHRDLKPANILIDSQHRVKLADFGLARCIEPPILDKLHDRRSSLELTNKVVTVMYRPIEILLGATRYGYSIDMWSAGCILGELVLGKTLMAGKQELEQLNLIFDLLGTPTPNDGLYDLPLLRTGKVKIDKPRPSRLREKYLKKISLPCLNLLEKLLELDPLKRLTASRALEARYFKTEPRAPDFPEQLGPLQLGNGDCDVHEFQTKKKRKEVKSIASAAREEAKESGMTDEAAETIFREVYDEQMLRVQEEGSSALKTREEREKEEEKKRRDEEKKREEVEKTRDEEGPKSRRDRSSDDARRSDRDKRRYLETDDRHHKDNNRGPDEVDRKRRKRDEDVNRKSDHHSDRDRKRSDDDIGKGTRRRTDDDKRSEKGRDRKRSSESREKDRHRSSDDKDREGRRREKVRHRLASEALIYDDSFGAVDRDRLGHELSPQHAHDFDETKEKEVDNRSRESKRSREHKKSSRRDPDRDRERQHESDGDRREKVRDTDHERRRRRDGNVGATPDYGCDGPALDDDCGLGRDMYDLGDRYGPPLVDRRSARGPPPDRNQYRDSAPSDRGARAPLDQGNNRGLHPSYRDFRGLYDNANDRGPASSDRGSRVLPDHRKEHIDSRTDGTHNRGPDHRNDRGLPPIERDYRGPDHRYDRIRPDRDGRLSLDHRDDRRPLPSDRDDRDPLPQRIGRGTPPEPWGDRGPLPRDLGSRGLPDQRGDRGQPPNGRDDRGLSWNDRAPPPLDWDSRAPAVPEYRRGHLDVTRDRGPAANSHFRSNVREFTDGPGVRGLLSHRDDRPPSREERRYSPSRDRRR